mmetsp:Transcript_18574/g.20653  ORF Transcript_18574/g.20653 Transcript_18574/m.20653 type:complete len:107 (-) Transcript_18574:23-343(-)
MTRVGKKIEPGMRKASAADLKAILAHFKKAWKAQQKDFAKQALAQQRVSLSAKQCDTIVRAAWKDNQYEVAKKCAKYCHEGKAAFESAMKRAMWSAEFAKIQPKLE